MRTCPFCYGPEGPNSPLKFYDDFFDPHEERQRGGSYRLGGWVHPACYEKSKQPLGSNDPGG